jgi:hypothetical protein
MTRYIVAIPLSIVNLLFILGIVFAILAQIIVYENGRPTRGRRVAMYFGIAATILLFAAGQIVGCMLREMFRQARAWRHEPAFARCAPSAHAVRAGFVLRCRSS